jgi:hypothetical protein
MYDVPGGDAPWDDNAIPSERAWVDPPPAEHEPPRIRDRSPWYWLLAVAVAVPLLTPLYNRVKPELFGLPFFYWCQFAFIFLGSAVTGVVTLATRRRGS